MIDQNPDDPIPPPPAGTGPVPPPPPAGAAPVPPPPGPGAAPVPPPPGAGTAQVTPPAGAPPDAPPTVGDPFAGEGSGGSGLSKRTLIIGVGAVAALIVGFLVLSGGGGSGPSGHEVQGTEARLSSEDASSLLVMAESRMTSIASGPRDQIHGDAACFFDRTDGVIALQGYCGPVLLDRSPSETAQWLPMALRSVGTDSEGDDAWSVEVGSTPVEPGSTEGFFRPDDAPVPKADLEFLPPPPVEENFSRSFEDLPNGDLTTHGTVVRSAGQSFSLEGSAMVDEVAFGAERLMPADGQRFLVIRTDIEGSGGYGGSARYVMVVDGVKRDVSIPSGLRTHVFGLPADTEEVELEISEREVVQTIDLISGETGDDLVEVLQREERQVPVNEKVVLPFNLTADNECGGAGEVSFRIETAEVGWGDSTLDTAGYGVDVRPPSTRSEANLLITVQGWDADGANRTCVYSPEIPGGTILLDVDGEGSSFKDSFSVQTNRMFAVVPADAKVITLTFAPGDGVPDRSEYAQRDNARYDFGDTSFEVTINLPD